jgi:hypothetical protein
MALQVGEDPVATLGPDAVQGSFEGFPVIHRLASRAHVKKRALPGPFDTSAFWRRDFALSINTKVKPASPFVNA